MRKAIAACAFLAALAAFVVIGGGGIVLAGMQDSGERGPGFAAALVAAFAFGCALVVVFAPRGAFGSGSRRALGMAAAFIGALPAAALSCAAFLFTGIPFGSRIPAVDWPVFAGGVAFALGAAATLALGYVRITSREAVADDEDVRPTRA
jgi:hypothetical protein